MDHKIFEKFGDSAQKVLTDSQNIAKSMNSGIDTHHMLMAVINLPHTYAYDLLRDYQITLEHVKMALSLRVVNPKISYGISPEAGKVLTHSFKIASDYKHSLVEAEHLLLAMMTMETCTAYKIIQHLGVNPLLIAQEIRRYFRDGGEEGIVEDVIVLEETEATPLATAFEPKQSKTKTPMLDYFTVDLSKKAKQKDLDPIIGRENEINRTIQILSRRTKNNPVLIGEPGVGKTAIVEGLAQRISTGQVPSQLRGKKLLNLDLALLVAGTMYRGQFEERMKKILEEIADSDTIIFIDELHTMVGAGSVEGSLDASNILKPALAKGKIRLIGATTVDEYRKYIEKDPALERRFQQIYVEEPSVEETIQILHGIKSNYEKHHRVTISGEAIELAAKLAKRYIQDRFLPDKAIDLIDEASAAKKIKSGWKNTKEATELQDKINTLEKKMQNLVAQKQFEKAAVLRDKMKGLEKQLKEMDKRDENVLEEIGPLDIAQAVSLWTSIPISNLIQEETSKYHNLEEILRQYIIGQNEAIDSIVSALKRAKAGIANPNRPIGSFMFLGPTGVGKTELAKVLAREIYGREESLIKIDMSEFMEKHNVSRLVGAPAGYIGYEDGGKLTDRIRRQPYSILLFDEIEKAHPDVFNIMLQILEDGYLTDAKGRRVNFRNTIIVMTSNIGLDSLTRSLSIGFDFSSGEDGEYEKIKEKVLTSLKDSFRPEFLNRLDNLVVFKPLNKEDIKRITLLQLDELVERLKASGHKLDFEPEIIEFLAERSYDPKLGARPVRRNIQELIENPLSDYIISQRSRKIQKAIKIALKKDRLAFSQNAQL